MGSLGVGIMNSVAFLLPANSNSKVNGNQISFGTIDFQAHLPTLTPVFASLEQEMDLTIGSLNFHIGSLGSIRLSDLSKSDPSVGKNATMAISESLVGDDRRNLGYRNYGREDSSNNKRFYSTGSREYNQSPDDMLNGPCHIHYAFIDGKRVSWHAMKDCKTFLKHQEVAGNKQAEIRRQGYEGNRNNAPPANQQATNGATQGQSQPNRGNDNDGGYIPSKGHITAVIQYVPKSHKEEKSISRQVNFVVTSPPVTTEYLDWSEQPIEFNREDHPITVPRPRNAPLVLKAQIGGYDIERVFMDAGSGINLIYTKML
jgi:hypothetical protein